MAEVLDLYEQNDQRPSLARQLDAGEPRVRVDAVRLRQASRNNLIKNALEAIGDERKPQLVIATRALGAAASPRSSSAWPTTAPVCRPTSTNAGTSPYTSSKARGTGPGLAVVKKIAEEHGGSVKASGQPAPVGGAEFTLCLLRSA
ncbi:MAG: hypothetical protein KIS89_04005 [Dokdonella sp.]|nr:hypothetical protein [Dokdonella sp.]